MILPTGSLWIRVDVSFASKSRRLVRRQYLSIGCQARGCSVCLTHVPWPALATETRHAFNLKYFSLTLHHKCPKSRYERYVEVFGMRAMSGHTGNPWTKTRRYATRIKPGDEKWMSVLSNSTILTNLGSIFTTGLVPGGHEQDSHDV